MKTALILSTVITSVLLLQGCETMQAVDKSLYSATRKTPTGARFDFSTRQKEIQEGEKAMNTLISQAQAKGVKLDGEAVGEETRQRATHIAQSLLSVTPYANESWSVRVIGDPAFNAFTTGGTSITFNAGLLKSVNECELGIVAGHEIAHVILGHASKRQTTQVLGLLTRHTKEVKGLQPFYTTQNEEEADQYGLLFATLAGYSPACGPALWATMFANHGNSAGDYAYDHPLNSERAQALTKLAQKYVRYYAGEGRINPQAQAIAKAELFGKEEAGLKAGAGGGFMRTLQAAMDTRLEYAKAQAEKSKRELLALRQQGITQSLQFLSANKEGDGVKVYLQNTSYSQINDIFSMYVRIGQSAEAIRIVQQVNGGIPARSKFSLLFKDSRLGNIYFSPTDVSVGVDSVIEQRF